jgi:hypothetical protein
LSSMPPEWESQIAEVITRQITFEDKLNRNSALYELELYSLEC